MGVKFLGGGINETCKFESCQGFFSSHLFGEGQEGDGGGGGGGDPLKKVFVYLGGS